MNVYYPEVVYNSGCKNNGDRPHNWEGVMHIIVNSRGVATVMDDVTIPMSTLARIINDWVPNGPARRALFLELSVILKDHNPEFTRSEFMSLCRSAQAGERPHDIVRNPAPAGWTNPPDDEGSD